MRLFKVLVTITAAAALAATAQAQGVQQDAVTADDLLLLFDNAVALEVDIPAGATTFSLLYGPANASNGMTTFLSQPGGGPAPTRLRVVVVLPDPAVVDPCAADEAEAVVIAYPHSEQSANSHHRLKVCVPHPAKSSITGASRTVIEGAVPTLNEWTPVIFKTWLVRAGQDENGAIDSTVDLQKNFIVQVGFSSGNSTSGPTSAAMSLEEIAALPAIAELIEEHGLLEER